jgi:hypothetical protein
MSLASTPRRPWRRIALAAAGVSLLATIAPLVGANPAAAVNAPLSTTDGVGIRIDENAIVGPALELIEDAMQPYVNQKIYEGALANSVMDDPDWVQGSANLELSFDFVNAGVSGYPQGGLKVRGDLQNIVMRFYRYGEWWQPECQFRVNPDNGWIDASAKVNTALLPNAPLQLNPISAYWDNDPSITREKGNWLCTGYLLDEWWDGLWGSGTDVADQLETELNGEAQDLINDLWAEHVTPIINSLAGFGITFNQVRTDDHGLIVTANTNATGGLTIPGLGGPYTVTNTPDAGVTSNVNTVLAARSEVTATIHPNVVNQYLNAINQFLNNQLGSVAPNGAAIESLLLPAASRGFYDDNLWTVSADVQAPYYTQPTGTGGRPQLHIPAMTITVRHPDYDFGFSPVAVFNGSMSGINLTTEVRPGTSNFGPSLNPSAATVSLTTDTGQTPAEVLGHMSATSFSTNSMLPYAKSIVDFYNDDLFVGYLSLAPINIGGLNVTLCTTCTRVSGDQRYTEFFNVG